MPCLPPQGKKLGDAAAARHGAPSLDDLRRWSPRCNRPCRQRLGNVGLERRRWRGDGRRVAGVSACSVVSDAGPCLCDSSRGKRGQKNCPSRPRTSPERSGSGKRMCRVEGQNNGAAGIGVPVDDAKSRNRLWLAHSAALRWYESALWRIRRGSCPPPPSCRSMSPPRRSC